MQIRQPLRDTPMQTAKNSIYKSKKRKIGEKKNNGDDYNLPRIHLLSYEHSTMATPYHSLTLSSFSRLSGIFGFSFINI